MMTRRFLVASAVLILAAARASAQGTPAPSTDARAFMGTWVFTMTEPDALKGSSQTVKIWDDQGVVAATVQVGRFPANTVTGIFKDGEILVLTIGHHAQATMRENGAPIWAVIALTVDGDSMALAQMLERSQTIKRGIGKRQRN